MMHLIIDMVGCRLWPDLEGGQRMLLELARALDMKPLSGPHVAELGNGSAIKGVSGVLIIIESHFAFHTWPELGQAYMDIFSCRAFDEKVAVEVVSHHFEPTLMSRRLLPRQALVTVH